jgi:multicomponent Na+:H+ antiporter subunit D
LIIPHAPILAIVLPLFAAFLTPVVSILAKRFGVERARDWFVVGAAILTLIVVVSMVPAVWRGEVLVYKLGGWTPPWGINLAIDGLNLLVALIIAGVVSSVAVYSVVSMERDSGLEKYYSLLMLVTAGSMGVALTGDIFNLYVFFEIMSISSYALVAFRRNWDSIEAGVKYMIIGCLGTSFILLGVAFLYGLVGSLNIADLAWKLAEIKVAQPLPVIVPLMLALFVAGLGIKIAMVPLHAWLPDAYQAAPSAVSAVLAGATTTAGVYAMLRISYMLFGALAIGLMLVVLGLITMVVGGLMALVQRDLKRLLAYSCISQIGYILLGVGYGTAMGIQGGLFHLLNNAIYKVLLFMCAGAIFYRVGTSNLDEMGGLGKNMPVTAGVFTVGALAISGVPPFNGFASKWTIYVAGMEAGQPIATVIAIIISALTLAYFLKAINSAFLGQRPKHLREVKEAPALMLIPMLALASLCVVFGILPGLGIDLVSPAQQAVMNQLGYIRSVLGVA